MNNEKRKILFIGPAFFGYDEIIKNDLVLTGAIVDYLPDRPFNSPLMKALIRYQRYLVLPIMDQIIIENIKKFRRAEYDFIFVIQGEGLSVNTLSIIKGLYPRAKMIWYLWDSLKNKKNLIPNLEYYDKCYTFDNSDALQYGLNFRPLFYSPNFKKKISPIIDFHLSFVGTAHSDRYEIISNIQNSISKEIVFYKYLYLQAPWLYRVYKTFNTNFSNAKISDFNFRPMPSDKVADIFSRSSSILDLQHPNQKGLTMRTFEALGASKKIVTTNKAIYETDFYDPENVLVLERLESINISKEFLLTPFKCLTDETIYRYSLRGWLFDILPELYTS